MEIDISNRGILQEHLDFIKDMDAEVVAHDKPKNGYTIKFNDISGEFWISETFVAEGIAIKKDTGAKFTNEV